MTPALTDVLDRLQVVSLPMRVRFRGITTRELALIDGPAGWGEFGAFLEYGDAEAAHWLAAALESAYRPPPPPLRTASTSTPPSRPSLPRRCPTSWPGSPARGRPR